MIEIGSAAKIDRTFFVGIHAYPLLFRPIQN